MVEATGGGLFEVAVPDGLAAGMTMQVELPLPPSEAITSPAHDDFGPSTASEAPDPYEGYLYRPGQRVQVLRSNGQYSPATIEDAFEGVFDVCYKVKLDNGLFKEAVPEDEISAAVSSDMGDLFDGYG